MASWRHFQTDLLEHEQTRKCRNVCQGFFSGEYRLNELKRAKRLFLCIKKSQDDNPVPVGVNRKRWSRSPHTSPCAFSARRHLFFSELWHVLSAQTVRRGMRPAFSLRRWTVFCVWDSVCILCLVSSSATPPVSGTVWRLFGLQGTVCGGWVTATGPD